VNLEHAFHGQTSARHDRVAGNPCESVSGQSLDLTAIRSCRLVYTEQTGLLYCIRWSNLQCIYIRKVKCRSYTLQKFIFVDCFVWGGALGLSPTHSTERVEPNVWG
jgi:hypothetical protein